MRKVLLAVCAVAFFAGASFAATPIKLSLWEKIAIPPADAVHGVELGLVSYTPELRGVSWNFLFAKTDDAIGVQIGMVTISNEFVGLLLGQFANFNKGSVKGLQWGFVNHTPSLTGLQIGVVNFAESGEGFALQIGFVNYMENSVIYRILPFINLKI
ncbi:MAG: hypothetical protein FWF00_05625 [Endomicrobia bacterium]|nr:hypothetical protein [Endomicrobiia bacterium]MCL2507148.1 hypothetical protein [Endomicrobiia bacterium]